jgi:hypothetical protein
MDAFRAHSAAEAGNDAVNRADTSGFERHRRAAPRVERRWDAVWRLAQCQSDENAAW